MFGIYVTHPQVRIDPDVPVPHWGLSELGTARAQAAARCGWATQLSRILSSDETKALETAAILARPAGVEVEVLEHAGENDRSATGFLVPEEFEKAANWFFANPEQSFHGWERAVDAQSPYCLRGFVRTRYARSVEADCLRRPRRRRHAAEMPSRRPADRAQP